MNSCRRNSFKYRLLRGFPGVYQLLSGLLWGGFWVHCAAVMEDFYLGTAMIVLAFAAGTLLRRVPGISIGKMGCWYIGCSAFLNFSWYVPAAFFFGMMDKKGCRRNSGGRFFCGFAAGALLGYCYNFALPALMGAGTIYFLFCRYRKRSSNWMQRLTALSFNAAVLTAVALLGSRMEMFNAYIPRQEKISRITRLSSFALSGKQKPEILLIAKQSPQWSLPAEYIIGEILTILPPGKFISGQYDIVVVEDVSAALSSAVHRLTNALKPGGVLVVPQRLCEKFPALQWQTLPSADNTVYAAAAVDRALNIDGEMIDENLLKIVRGYAGQENMLLPGGLSGALVEFKSRPLAIEPTLPVSDYGKLLWCGVIALILLEIVLHGGRGMDIWCAGIASLNFALICGLLLGKNQINQMLDGDWLIAALALGAFFIELPFKVSVLRVFSCLSCALLWLWWFIPCFWTAAPAIFFSALAFSGSKNYFSGMTRYGNLLSDLVIAAAFAGGFILGGNCGNMVSAALAAVCVLKFWLLLRS